MTAQITAGNLSDNARTESELKTGIEAIVSLIKECLGGTDEVAKTIASDAFATDHNACAYNLDTEAAAATDNLATINATNSRVGEILLIRSVSSGRVITVKHSTGNISTVDGADYVLKDPKQFLMLKYKGTTWEEVARTERLFIAQLPGAATESELTIASGSVTATRAIHELQPESSTSDDLDFIVQTAMDGHLLLIHTADTGDSITVRHNQSGTGKILLSDSTNLLLDTPNKFLLLMKKGTTWEEVGRFGFTIAGLDVDYKSGTFTAGTGHKIYVCTGSFTATLPSLASATSDNSYLTFYNEGTDEVTIQRAGSDTIEGATTTIVLPKNKVALLPCSSEWKVMN